MPQTLTEEAARIAAGEFAGEPIRWFARPDVRRAGLLALRSWAFAIPWTAFSIYWIWSATQSSRDAVFPLFGVPFLVVGIWQMSAPLRKMLLAQRTLYVLTAKRLAIIEDGWSRKVRSIHPLGFLSIARTERSDASGDIRIVTGFGKDSEGGRTELSETLVGIPDVRSVESQIRSVLDKAAN